MYDFHSHVLFGVDDGAKDEEMSLNMLRIAAESGTKVIVATPHFVRDRFQVPRNKIKAKVEKLRELAKENQIPIELYLGQEVYYSEQMLKYYEDGEIGTIENTRYMLVELPMREFHTERVIDGFYELQLKGIKVILAHPERYEEFIKKPDLINRFIEEGFLFQLNTGSIAGDFGKNVKKTAEVFLKNRVYSLIGSDAHRDKSRNTDMTSGVKAIEKIKPGMTREFMMNAEKILKDEVVRCKGKKVSKAKGIKGVLKRVFN